MKLKYRIKQWSHSLCKDYFTAQYKIFGLWLNINSMQVGRFTKPSSVMCETFNEAKKRVDIHKLNMERAKWWTDRSGFVVWNEDGDEDEV